MWTGTDPTTGTSGTDADFTASFSPTAYDVTAARIILNATGSGLGLRAKIDAVSLQAAGKSLPTGSNAVRWS